MYTRIKIVKFLNHIISVTEDLKLNLLLDNFESTEKLLKEIEKVDLDLCLVITNFIKGEK